MRLRQWSVLTRHDIGILTGNRLTAAILAGSPVTIPLMFSRPVAVDWAILAGFTALFLALTCLVLARGTAKGGR